MARLFATFVKSSVTSVVKSGLFTAEVTEDFTEATEGLKRRRKHGE
jgi:hypothetical protein